MPFIPVDKSKHKYIIGIDFGHGETSVSIAPIGWEKKCDQLEPAYDIEFKKGGTMFSCFAQNNTIATENKVGTESYMYGYLRNPQTNDFLWDFHSYFKATPSELAAREEINVMATFMKFVYEKVLELKGGEGGFLTNDNHLVYLACPSSSVKWTEEEKEAYARIASDVAKLPLCEISGFSKGIIRESRAAFILAKSKKDIPVSDGILIIDFGSSTLDLTYYSDKLLKPLDEGYELGAQKIEHLIYEDILAHLEEHFSDEQIRNEVKNGLANERIKNIVLLALRESKEKFYDSEAVEELVVNLNISSLLGIPNLPKIRAFYSANQIDEMLGMKEYISSVKLAFKDFKENILKDNVIKSVFLTGGASRMYWLKDAVKQIFGESVVFSKDIGDCSTAISRGIALAGRADVRTTLLEDNLPEDIYEPGDIAEQIINTVAENKSRIAYEDMWNKVKFFKEAIFERSIDELKSSISDGLKYINMDISDTYASHVRMKIERTVQSKINELIHEYFSHDVNINISQNRKFDTKKLSNLSWSVRSVVDICFDEVHDIALTKVAKVGLNTCITVSHILGNLAKGAVNLTSNIINGEDVYEYTDLDEDWEKITKTSTPLNSSQRARVFSAFESAKSQIQSRIKEDIKTNDNYSLKIQINNAYKEDVKSFIADAIKEARMILD